MSDDGVKGTIRFFEACLPLLPPHDYKLTVTQKLENVPGAEEIPAEELEFSVAGPRFSLDPADVYSVYPPAGLTGPFDNTLPHVVLNRRTTPWERTISGALQDAKNHCPWMALLVVSPRDFPPDGELPRVVARTVGELLHAKEDEQPAIQSPDIKEFDPTKAGEEGGPPRLAEYERSGDLCNTIDLDADLLQMILPDKRELRLLAHVRNVKVDNKETLSYVHEGAFSLVVSNRFPETALGIDPNEHADAAKAGRSSPIPLPAKGRGARNLALLVSVEGFDQILWDDAGKPKAAPTEKVRLAVLAHWTFTCHGNNHFKVLMNDLDDGPPLKFSHDDKEIVIWKLANRQARERKLTGVELLDSFGGSLAKLELDGREIFDGSHASGPVKKIDLADTIADGGGPATISKHSSSYLVFRFRENVEPDPRRYRLRATFADGGHVEFRAGDGAAGRLSLPLPEAPAGDEGMKSVRHAFELGFVGLNHHLRIGEKTVSWYRGPLVAPKPSKKARYAFAASPDAALRYDPETGLFDTSYAAAWQLGRLLALQNRTFARAVYRFRKEHAEREAAEVRTERARREQLVRALEVMKDEGRKVIDRYAAPQRKVPSK